MPLSVGDKLGPYEILAPLGAGGMGEVYRARDSKLNRDVAIKVLPAAFANDAQYMARFAREAQVLASINHPNIATLYGLEQGALVMELVAGADLHGPLPLEEAIPIARQIAAGLEAAHERGIVHRDLKPANIKVTPSGQVKLLDFGLAVARSSRPVSGDPTESPTLSLAMTQAGMILGTAAYMSPEQARGKPVDKRADIWAFGVVLYELLTGKRLFEGEDLTETLASVVKDTPDLGKLPPSTPAHILRLLDRCLRKDPNTRLRDIGEARVALDEPEPVVAPQTVVPQAEARAAWLPWAMTAVAAVAALGLGYIAFRHTTEEAPRVVKVSVLPPEKATYPVHEAVPAISPDGRHVAFSAIVDGKLSLWVRDLDALTPRPLAGTDEAVFPFWSPDSRFIGFFARNKLLKIELAGGPPLTICEGIVGTGRGATWSASGTIVFAANARSGLFRVPAAGGTAMQLTELDKSLNESVHWYPWFLPDGRHFLYTARAGDAEQSVVYVADVDAKDPARSRRKAVAANSEAMYAPPGYLLFLRERTLMAQPFDAGRGETTGDAVPVAEQVDHAAGLTMGSFMVAQSGALAYISGGGDSDRQFSWLDRSGKEMAKVGVPGSYTDFRLSPDEQRIAFERTDPQSRNLDIWVMDLARGVMSRLTFESTLNTFPVWSPDGLRILYAGNRPGAHNLYMKAATGAGQEETLLKPGTPNARGTSWSRDGRFVMYQTGGVGAKTGLDLWIAPQFGDRKPLPYLQTQFNERDGAFSPDGRWVAYVSDESGRYEIYVQAFPLSGAKFQVSAGGGVEPTWRRDGSELFYRSADGNLVAVPVKSGATFEVGAPRPLFRIPSAATSNPFDSYIYASSNDGQRFLVAANPGGEKTAPITVVLNWQAGLKK